MTDREQIEEELARRDENKRHVRQGLIVTCECGHVSVGIETFEKHLLEIHLKK